MGDKKTFSIKGVLESQAGSGGGNGAREIGEREK